MATKPDIKRSNFGKNFDASDLNKKHDVQALLFGSLDP